MNDCKVSATCVICSGKFEVKKHGLGRAKYCPECKKQVVYEQNKAHYERKKKAIKEKKKENESTKGIMTLSEFALLARENGMSYGQFSAKMLNNN